MWLRASLGASANGPLIALSFASEKSLFRKFPVATPFVSFS